MFQPTQCWLSITLGDADPPLPVLRGEGPPGQAGCCRTQSPSPPTVGESKDDGSGEAG